MAFAELLPPNALSGVTLGVSVSESPDLGRLGLLENHFRLAVAEIARTVLVGGGGIAYGGHIEPDGYTNFLLQEVHRYSRRDQPLRIILAYSEHRRFPLSDLQSFESDLGVFGSVTYLSAEGKPMQVASDRNEAPEPIDDPALVVQCLSAMRRYMAEQLDGRIFIGGKREGYRGACPGLLEEALYAVEANHPVYIAGGFGGISSDMALALGFDDREWMPTSMREVEVDRQTEDALQRLGLHRVDFSRLMEINGLSEVEAKQLAASYRPSEIAALVSLGLARRFHETS